MTIPERAAQIAVQIANDDRHGYSQANRYGTLEGEGIAKNGVVKVDIPIFSASARK